MDDLIRRLRERAADPRRRTDAPRSISFSGPGGTVTSQFGSLEGMLAGGGYAPRDQPGGSGGGSGGGGGILGGLGSLGALMADLQRVVAANQAGRPIDADIVERVEGMVAGSSTDTPSELPSPAAETTLGAAEAKLGFALPPPLRRVYAEVANGGFGPGAGLLPVEDAVTTYLDKVSNPWGRSMAWPPELLPIQDVDPGLVSIDVNTGRILDWDPEELTERSSERTWQASFTEVASSLEAWLEDWVESRPQHEVIQDELDASTIQQARESRAMIAAMTPEERAAMGLPEVGWEQVVWGGIGLEPDDARSEPEA
jgi:hypothetical protein